MEKAKQHSVTRVKKLLAKTALLFWFDLEWILYREARRSRSMLRKLHNLHRGESCVIIGNGPSLQQMELYWLRDYYTFGLNRIYLKFPEWGFSTSYYVAVNQLVIEQCAKEIIGLKIPKFLGWYWREYLEGNQEPIYIRYRRVGDLGFSKNPTWKIWEGSTVTFVAMQLAYYMGFSKVYLIGVDHQFSAKGDPDKLVVSQGPDKDHFDPNYFGKGFRWHLPNLERSERAYQLAKKAFEMDGREILDATVNGKLDVFPKMDYRSLSRKE